MAQKDIPLSETPYRDTDVTAARSQEAIRKLLTKHQVEDVQWTHRGQRLVLVGFAKDDPRGHKFAYKLGVEYLTEDERGEMQGHRMLYWWMKGILESIEFGIYDFETIMMPFQLVFTEAGPKTLAEVIRPQLAAGGDNIDPFRAAIPERNPQY